MTEPVAAGPAAGSLRPPPAPVGPVFAPPPGLAVRAAVPAELAPVVPGGGDLRFAPPDEERTVVRAPAAGEVTEATGLAGLAAAAEVTEVVRSAEGDPAPSDAEPVGPRFAAPSISVPPPMPVVPALHSQHGPGAPQQSALGWVPPPAPPQLHPTPQPWRPAVQPGVPQPGPAAWAPQFAPPAWQPAWAPPSDTPHSPTSGGTSKPAYASFGPAHRPASFPVAPAHPESHRGQPSDTQQSDSRPPVTGARPGGRRVRRRSIAWLYYAVLTVLCVVASISIPEPRALLGALLCGLYSIYLFRGGRFVLWIW